jgi:arabinofuranosyltransferase
MLTQATTENTVAQTPPIVTRPSATRFAWAMLAIGLGFLFYLQIRHFPAFYSDDGFISLRYSARLLQGKGLTWNDFKPVEGYSNLLWVLACACLGALGLPLDFASVILGIACAAIGIVAVAAQARRDYSEETRWLAALFGCGALVLNGPVALWAQSALEPAMLAAFLGWATYFGLSWVATDAPSVKDTVILGVLLGFVSLTRADGALFVALFFAGGLIADGIFSRGSLRRIYMLFIPAIFLGAQVAFRRLYYGEWIPNTAYVKVAFTLQRVLSGIRYDVAGIAIEAAFFALTCIGFVALWRDGRRRQVRFLIVVSLGWLAYVAFIGGDIFQYKRHFIPLLAVLSFAISGCSLILVRGSRLLRLQTAGLCILLGLVLTTDLFFNPKSELADEAKSVALFLKQAFENRQPLVSADPAGSVPFYTNFPAIDPLGLNDYHIARHKTRAFGHGQLGHELADGGYVLDQRPDLIILCNYWASSCWESDREITQDPRFPRFYQLVRFKTSTPLEIEAAIYVRRTDSKIGIQQTADKVIIPGYLAVAHDPNAVRLADGRAQLILPPGGSAEFEGIPVPSGSWSFQVRSKDATSVGVSDLHSSDPGVIGAGFAADKRVPLSGMIGFKLENRGASPAVVDSVSLVRGN